MPFSVLFVADVVSNKFSFLVLLLTELALPLLLPRFTLRDFFLSFFLFSSVFDLPNFYIENLLMLLWFSFIDLICKTLFLFFYLKFVARKKREK